MCMCDCPQFFLYNFAYLVILLELMNKINTKDISFSGWSFAIINGKLAEIYFDVGKGVSGIKGHCFVKRSEYKTKTEQKMIDKDIEKFNLTYRNKKYKEKI